MTLYLEAADAVEREAARAESLAKVAADLRRVGSLQQAGDEAQNRLEAINAQIVDVERIETEAKAKADAIVRAAQDHAEAARAALQAEADTHKAVVANDRGTIAKLLSDVADERVGAEVAASAILAKANQDAAAIVAAAQTEAEGYGAAIVAGKERLRIATEAADAAEARLSDVNQQLAALRSKL